MTDLERHITDAMRSLESISGYAKELEDIRRHFANVLEMLTPGGGNQLLTASGDGWPHSSTLEEGILHWLSECSGQDEISRPSKRQVLPDEGSMV